MSPEKENFEQLRRLLALKRHEQPPPGYFHDFSRQVLARIQADEAVAKSSLLGRLAPWVGNLWEGFEAKPVLAGAFGVGVCSLLIFGLVSSERMDSNPTDLPAGGGASRALFANVPDQTVGTSLFERAQAETVAVPTAQTNSSIFEEIQRPRVQPVNFSAPAPSN
jgi:hypothetical protein